MLCTKDNKCYYTLNNKMFSHHFGKRSILGFITSFTFYNFVPS